MCWQYSLPKIYTVFYNRKYWYQNQAKSSNPNNIEYMEFYLKLDTFTSAVELTEPTKLIHLVHLSALHLGMTNLWRFNFTWQFMPTYILHIFCGMEGNTLDHTLLPVMAWCRLIFDFHSDVNLGLAADIRFFTLVGQANNGYMQIWHSRNVTNIENWLQW